MINAKKLEELAKGNFEHNRPGYESPKRADDRYLTEAAKKNFWRNRG